MAYHEAQPGDRIRFRTGTEVTDYFEVYLTDDGALSVRHGESYLAVRPRASNLIKVEAVDD